MVRLADDAASAAADAVCAQLDNGVLEIYSQLGTLLARLRFGAPAFGTAVAGIAVSHPLEPEQDAPASGTATMFRAYRSDGRSIVFDGSVGREGADLNLSSAQITAGVSVSLSAVTYVHRRE